MGKELLITSYLTLYNLNTTASIVIIGLGMIRIFHKYVGISQGIPLLFD